MDPVRRRRLADAGCVLLAVTLLAFAWWDGAHRHIAAAALSADLAAGALCCLGLGLRRSRPVGFAVAVGVCAVLARSASGVALIALFGLAARRPWPVVLPVAAGYGLSALLLPLTRPDWSMSYRTHVLPGLLGTAALVGWGMLARTRRELLASLRERARRAETDQELRVAEARQLERHRIAREMHDVLGHRISLLSLHAGALELRPDAPSADILRTAGLMRLTARQAMDELREVIGVLRIDDAGIRPQPSLAGLAALVQESRHAGMRVALDCAVEPGDVPEGVGRDAYRIVQEGLTNARRHAPGTEVTVRVGGAATGGLTVDVRNPCPAGATDAGAGMGLAGLGERVALAGGRLTHDRAAGTFHLSAWLPWPDRPA